MKSNTRSYTVAIAALCVSLASSQTGLAQSGVSERERHNFETRAELESQVSAAEAKGDQSEARLIHYRLDHGDFQEGDRIVIKVQGAGGFADTATVRSGKRLQLPQMADLSVDGVLRSELSSRLTTFIGGYLRDPVVQATPLVRVGVLGSVSRPGYYYAPADLPLSDVLMTAGGPTPDADVGRVSVRRAGQIIIDERNTRTALTEGLSIDKLNLQAGDEISVGHQRNLNWGIIVPTVTGILGLLVAFTQLHR